MKRPWLRLILPALFLVVVGWLFFTSLKIDQAFPPNTAAVIQFRSPLELADKICGHDLVRSLVKLPELKEAEGFLVDWNKLRSRSDLLTAALYYIKSAGLLILPDKSPNSQSRWPFVIYCDLGWLGRTASAAGALLPNSGKPSYRGYEIHRTGEFAACLVRNLVLAGPEANVRLAIDAVEGGSGRATEALDRYKKTLALADRQADLTAIILDRSIFQAPPEKKGGFDFRSFLSAPAIDQAAMNVYLGHDDLSVRLALVPVPGKTISPLTLDRPGRFISFPLLDERTLIYAAIRVERPTALSPLLLDALSGDREGQKLRQKLAMLMLNTFLEYSGHELAVMFDDQYPAGLPTLVFQIPEPEKALEAMNKMTKSSDASNNVLNFPIGEGGLTLAQTLKNKISQSELEKLLTLLPPDQRMEVTDLARRIRDGSLQPEEVIMDPQRIAFYGHALHWRLADHLLILAPLPDLAQRYQHNFDANQPLAWLAGQNPPVPLDGPFVGWINLAGLIAGISEDRQLWMGPVAEGQPRLMIGTRAQEKQLEITVKLLSSWRANYEPINASVSWLTLFRCAYGTGILTILGAAIIVLRTLFGYFINRRRGSRLN